MPRPLLDRVTTTLADQPSRRRLLRSLVGSAVGVLAVGLGVRESAANGAGIREDRPRPNPRRKPKPRPEPRPRPRLRGFSARSTSQVTEAAVAGCNNPAGPSAGQCTTTFEGTGTAAHLGRVAYTSSFTSDWSQAVNTGPEGFCAPVVGTATLRSISTNTRRRGAITLQFTGTVCETAVDGDSYPLVFDGTYQIVRGTGRYTDATGNGTAEGAAYGPGAGAVATFAAQGRIRF